MKPFLRSLGFAIAGWRHVLRTEPNMRIHLAAAAGAVGAGLFLGITTAEWIGVIGAIGLVMSLECCNTALERLADRVSPEQHPLIAQAKDASAAAVLIASLTAVAIGCLVFLPKMVAWLSNTG